ncbi:hypothetical protein [Fimbriimonas ginsengisoli]|uniref:Uncharacterized protein n=1 Tax=Fimbriimonas ginsengisoli Gsoil 348 TaxID=661478 RepID=A0A068NJ95_FIMGI|nr:hypothetical protein [Fimbriimonas ginsengisoli]AIE83527.1 hypothetical protein OP10G_0159 [Fimbriimonas ginsengisoli Gsoil 348]
MENQNAQGQLSAPETDLSTLKLAELIAVAATHGLSFPAVGTSKQTVIDAIVAKRLEEGAGNTSGAPQNSDQTPKDGNETEGTGDNAAESNGDEPERWRWLSREVGTGPASAEDPDGWYDAQVFPDGSAEVLVYANTSRLNRPAHHRESQDLFIKVTSLDDFIHRLISLRYGALDIFLEKIGAQVPMDGDWADVIEEANRAASL